MTRAIKFLGVVIVAALALSVTSCEIIPLFEVDIISVRFDSTSSWTGVSVTFRATIDNANAYNWDFGDGNTGSGQIVKHLYESEGIFTVTLELVTDADSFEYSKEVRVFAEFTRLLSIAGTGDGQVTGASAINCTITSSTASGQCDEEVEEGTEVTLIATPEADFDSWTNCNNPVENICTHTVTSDVTITANLVEFFTLTVVPLGADPHVVSNIGGIDCPGICSAVFASGTVVQLTALTDFGGIFAVWDSCVAFVPNQSIDVTITGDVTCRAQYVP